MKISMQLLLAALTSTVLLGCGVTESRPESREFAELRIESHPRGWGYAYKTVKPDGSISGGHLSGGADAPRVFESKSQLTSQDMSTLRALVAAMAAEPMKEQPSPPDQKLEGYTSVVIILGDGTTTTVISKWGQRFQSNTIQNIWDTVSKYKVGAW